MSNGNGNIWYWVGQEYAADDKNYGISGTVHGDEGFVTIKNCWNNAANWVRPFDGGANDPPVHDCTGNTTGGYGGGRGGTYYLPATGYPGEFACLGAQNVKFSRLPHNPQAGLCNGPYPKSECLYGGAGTGGFYGGDQIANTGTCTMYGESELYRIQANPTYFDANLYPNLTKPCTGAPLERLRLGAHLQTPIKNTSSELDDPYGQGYYFEGLNFRAMQVIVDMRGQVRETDRDQCQCILADPQNGGWFWRVFGEGDFYGKATRFISGAGGFMGAELAGNGVELLECYPQEYGSTGPNYGDKCNYNKSMTIQWIGTVRGRALVGGGQVERVLFKPSPEFDQRRFFSPNVTGPTGSTYPSIYFACDNVYTGEVADWDDIGTTPENRRPCEHHFHARSTVFYGQRNDCGAKGTWPYHIMAGGINGNTGYVFNAIHGAATSNVTDTNETFGCKFHSEGQVWTTGSGEKVFERVDIINKMDMEQGQFAFGDINSQVFIRGGTIQNTSKLNLDFTGEGQVEIMGMATGGNDSQWRDAEPEKGLLMVQDEDNPGIIGIPKGSYIAFRGPTGYEFRSASDNTSFFDNSGGK